MEQSNGGVLWGVITIGGPILFMAAVLYAVLRNKFQRNQPPKEVSERGARELREKLNEEDTALDNENK